MFEVEISYKNNKLNQKPDIEWIESFLLDSYNT